MISRGAALALLLFAAVAFAQPKAQISGFVRDTSDAVVQDAAIAVINLDTGVRRSTASNKEGFYAIASLSPGNYKITVRKPGFQTVARTGISFHALDASRLDFSLEVGSMYEEVTVESLPPLMNTADAAQGMTSSRKPAEFLPVNGRGLQALIDLAPGVLTTPATAGEAGQFSANGQRPGTNYFTVDGVSANNGISGSGLPGQFSGGALPAMTAIGSLHNLVSLGELDELRVQTSSFAPEYGRLPGAQVSVSTRSGSNDFHGELFLSGRHEIGAAADPFGKAAGPARTEAATHRRRRQLRRSASPQRDFLRLFGRKHPSPPACDVSLRRTFTEVAKRSRVIHATHCACLPAAEWSRSIGGFGTAYRAGRESILRRCDEHARGSGSWRLGISCSYATTARHRQARPDTSSETSRISVRRHSPWVA